MTDLFDPPELRGERLSLRPTAPGDEAAVPLLVRVRREGVTMEVDVIDVAKVDAQGRVVSMRALAQ